MVGSNYDDNIKMVNCLQRLSTKTQSEAFY